MIKEIEYDTIEKLDNTIIQHGKFNDRIYVIKLSRGDFPRIVPRLQQLAQKHHYQKIIIKAPEWAKNDLEKLGFVEEAAIPGFYEGKGTVHFMAGFLNPERGVISHLRQQEILQKLDIARDKGQDPAGPASLWPSDQSPIVLHADHIPQLAALYQAVFDSYPFPIFEESYLLKTLRGHIVYFGIFNNGTLIAASSAETDPEAGNAEMTDFATLPEYRGNGLARVLLAAMEAEMAQRGISTLYTIARTESTGMNVTFAKSGYHFSGTLVNNTHIAGHIESMNVWYKSLGLI
ncbi:MAG TPA: putative beta-lysine N-acetyltransferase [Calditrichia bacterium]|nr:putative beta-lysine N-acetyltransferase [Calditrichia bacterium]HQV30409.1 putative beta-lysine N-acetyltransferase [Calditrichia bacterium]